ncbi:hypothetical protein [Duffyella gerundensis]|uniref:hypothetical protein n=1 Tax=Duffyella TaxID=3026546 RepID=UPI003F6E01C8
MSEILHHLVVFLVIEECLQLASRSASIGQRRDNFIQRADFVTLFILSTVMVSVG